MAGVGEMLFYGRKREAKVRGVIESIFSNGDLQGIAGKARQEIDGLELLIEARVATNQSERVIEYRLASARGPEL